MGKNQTEADMIWSKVGNSFVSCGHKIGLHFILNPSQTQNILRTLMITCIKYEHEIVVKKNFIYL